MSVTKTDTIDFWFNTIYEAEEFKIDVLREFQTNPNKTINLATVLEFYGMEKDLMEASDYTRGWKTMPSISEPEETKCGKFLVRINAPTARIKIKVYEGE